MKKLIIIMIAVSLLVSCGGFNKKRDEMSYISLTGRTVDLRVFSGGVLIEEYKNVEVEYSNSDSETLWINTPTGLVYIQGEVIANIK